MQIINTEDASASDSKSWKVILDDKDGLYKYYHEPTNTIIENEDINKVYDIKVFDIGHINADDTAEVQLTSKEWTVINLNAVGLVKLGESINDETRKKFANNSDDESE